MQIVVNYDDNNAVHYFGKRYELTETGIRILNEDGLLMIEIEDPVNANTSEVFDVDLFDLPANIEPRKYIYVLGSAGYEFVENPEFAVTPPTHNNQRLREKIARDIHDFRNIYTSQGFYFGGRKFQSDPHSIQLLNNATTGVLSMISLGAGEGGAVVPWTLADNSTVLITGAEFLQVAAAVVGWFSECFNVARFHKDIVLYDLESREEILSYDYTELWWPSRDLGGTLVHAT